MPPARVHPTSHVSPEARVGDGTQVWQFCHVRERVRIGASCVLGSGVYVDRDVVIGDNVKIQDHVSVYQGVTLEDGVFVGPHACFTNDRVPRAVNPDMTVKGPSEWRLTRTLVRAGASIGANATIVCGITIGRWAMVGAGAVVTADVPDHALVVGCPARVAGWRCACGQAVDVGPERPRGVCECGRALRWEGGAAHPE
jgi:acetyltransferase-like isoleucine patch superfamily enzyme